MVSLFVVSVRFCHFACFLSFIFVLSSVPACPPVLATEGRDDDVIDECFEDVRTWYRTVRTSTYNLY